LATKETTEQTPQAKPEILAAIDDEIETTDKRQIAAKRKQNKAKFGDLYTKAVRVTKDFQNIINTLEQQGKITKKCP
jgi:molecular chaperone GrpE (heat shock protein)